MAQPRKTLSKPKDLGEPGVKSRVQEKAKSIWARAKGLPLGKIGAATGLGVVAVAFLGAPLVPVALAATGVGGYYVYKSRKYSHAMTPERIKVYEQALSSLKDAKKLRVLADEFEKAGCAREAEHLRKRASLQELSPEEKKANKNRYRAAMAVADSSKVLSEADYFQGIGADGAAKNLRTRADALRAVGK